MERQSHKKPLWSKVQSNTFSRVGQPRDVHGTGQSHRLATALDATVDPDISAPPETRPSTFSLSNTKLVVRPGPSVSLTLSEELWSNAYQALKKREPVLVENYERQFSPDDATFTSPEQMRTVIRAGLERRDAKQLLIPLVGKPLKFRECGEKLVKFVVWSKDLVSAAVSAEPHAALAWVGVSLLLPLVINASQQSQAMIQGLDSIADLIQIYKIREDMYAKSRRHAGFEDAVTQMYSLVLEYQARMLCHLSKKSLIRGFKNVFKPGQWDDLLKAIEGASGQCLQYSALIDIEVERVHWDRQQLQLHAPTTSRSK